MFNFVFQLDTVVLCMSGVLTIEAGCIWLQCPIGTMCQLGLSLPAYAIRGTLILGALQCFQAPLHGHGTGCFCHCLYHFFRTEQVFQFFCCLLKPCSVWLLLWLFQHLEHQFYAVSFGSCGTTDLPSPHYPLLQMSHLPPLHVSHTIKHQCQPTLEWVKLLESGKDKHFPLATTPK